jgi:hypothetical protein
VFVRNSKSHSNLSAAGQKVARLHQNYHMVWIAESTRLVGFLRFAEQGQRRQAGGVNRMRPGVVILLAFSLFCIPIPHASAASCTTQSQMNAAQRDALSSAARTILTEMQSGDTEALRANTIPPVASDFGGITSSVEYLKPLLQNAAVTVNNLYILDGSNQQAGVTRSDFYCGQPVVALNFTNLPAGMYALAILHATGVSQPQQVSLILADQTGGNKWMLAGLFIKPMVMAGHDGLWYWTSARQYAQRNMDWDAWLYYRIAMNLLDPLNALSSPNSEKLEHEMDKIKSANLPGPTPLLLSSHGENYSVTGIGTTTAFGRLDLDLHYTPDAGQLSQLHDPPTARQQVMNIMSALLEQHPELQQAFRGIWVHADQGSASLFALDLPMDGIVGGSPSKPQPAPR